MKTAKMTDNGDDYDDGDGYRTAGEEETNGRFKYNNQHDDGRQ